MRLIRHNGSRQHDRQDHLRHRLSQSLDLWGNPGTNWDGILVDAPGLEPRTPLHVSRGTAVFVGVTPDRSVRSKPLWHRSFLYFSQEHRETPVHTDLHPRSPQKSPQLERRALIVPVHSLVI